MWCMSNMLCLCSMMLIMVGMGCKGVVLLVVDMVVFICWCK